jgi:hypothetical protein
MFSHSSSVPFAERTVGVLNKDDKLHSPGFNLLPFGKQIYLFDCDGRVVHEWVSNRNCFCCYLLKNGNLLRDGSDANFAPDFRTGGSAGYVEEVTWDGEVVWSFDHAPYFDKLSHHDLEPLSNGNVLIMSWEKKSKKECEEAGRRPELIPEGEVWDTAILELKPNDEGGADVVWRWSLWDHSVQDYDSSKEANYVQNIREHPESFDINYCPTGGIAGARNESLLFANVKPEELTHAGHISMRGGKDWLHSNSVAYDSVRDQVLISLNAVSEIIIVDHSTTIIESQGSTGGKSGKGGDILYRWGNPQTHQTGSRIDQQLFNQHSVHFLRDVPGDGHVLLFNNGKIPNRHWSSIDEIKLPETEANSGVYVTNTAGKKRFGPKAPAWTFGPKAHHQNSFFCTHISGVQRLPNGNNLITMGPQGMLVEVTSSGEEVWRYVSPVCQVGSGSASSTIVSFVRQGEHRPEEGRFSLFRVQRYAPDYPAFVGKESVMTPGRFLEA